MSFSRHLLSFWVDIVLSAFFAFVRGCSCKKHIRSLGFAVTPSYHVLVFGRAAHIQQYTRPFVIHRHPAPSFCLPATPRYHADIAPLPPGTAEKGSPVAGVETAEGGGGGLEGQQGKARYRPVNWGEFRLKRFAGDYADQGTEEVQISHYLLDP